MKILAVRIGEKYGPEYETYLEKKLPEYDFHFKIILSTFRPSFAQQEALVLHLLMGLS